ncbi:MAG TPA: helix-turn-helix domain-containing protein [Solirubrobacteraceae bacterium]|nr:helix-turn-helix domain-containing protein [Solirubrobacteraceae bacterium]
MSDDDGELTEATGSGSRRRRPRRISDLDTLRALAHPTRIALLETLVIRGAMTATEAAEHVGESPSSCSFHLRQLQRFGFVEEAGGGHGRRRPWRMTELGLHFSTEEGDAATRIAARALHQLVRGRQLERYQVWQETRSSYPAEWREAALDSQSLVWMTSEELSALGERLRDVIPGLYERIEDPSARPPGALPVELLMLGHPIAPPSKRG